MEFLAHGIVYFSPSTSWNTAPPEVKGSELLGTRACKVPPAQSSPASSSGLLWITECTNLTSSYFYPAYISCVKKIFTAELLSAGTPLFYMATKGHK